MKCITGNKTFWLLFLICLVTLYPFLGLYDYNTKGEPREAIVSYSMLQQGNWILPRNNGGEMAYKPPFFHWCVAAVSAVNGEVTELTSRLPSAIALTILVLCTFAVIAKRKGEKTAMITALLMLTCLELHRAGCNCRVDMVLTMLTVCALYVLFKWYEKGMRGVPWIAVLLMSLGTLTKGPVGSIIPCLVMGVFLLLRGENFFKTFFKFIAFGILSLILPALWYYAAYREGGQAFLNLMLEENVGRMTNTMSYDSCVNPWPYNVMTVIAGFVPWTLLAVISLFFLKYGKPALNLSALWKRFTHYIKGMNAFNLFSLVSIVVIFIFYCIPQSKRSVYLMPIYPFIAYFLARYMIWLSDNHPKAIRIFGSIISIAGIMLFGVFVALKCGVVPDTIFHGHHAEENILMMHSLENISGLIPWLFIAAVTLICCAWWNRIAHVNKNRSIYAIFTILMAIYLSVDCIYKPDVLNTRSQKPLATEINRLFPANKGKLYEYIEASVKAKGDPIHFFDLNFYLGNRIGNFYKEHPKKGYLLIGDVDAQRNLTAFEKEGYRFRLCYKSPKRSSGQLMQVYDFFLCK